ncbi:hypothetical protein CFK37_08925 [Virgibacillus phasianinus]|uniref:Uncharacterized protein n=1 Tax=Virgibacillus phasianinus TaxID=2017483 RepID=A0A220U3F9_9BACI|nr:hypothetical protein CFK37_08925 [Virgibacillus phasianinus]
MTYANRPWRIILALKSVVAVAVAVATDAYGLVFTTLWSNRVSYGYLRFMVLMADGGHGDRFLDPLLYIKRGIKILL